MIQDTVVIGGECSLETRIEGDCDLTSMVEGDPDVLVVEGGGQTYPHYSGSYTVNPSTSQQVLQTDGKVMDDDVTVQAVQAGSATTPATIITANPSISVSSGGLITAQVSKTQQITPTVVEGYVSAGTAGNVGVSGSNTQQLTTQGAQTIHPASTDQSIASGKYLTGAQTFKAVTVSGLTADKVLQGNTVEIGDSDDSDRIMKVVGTAQGGITPTGTKQISITQNGTTTEDVTNYASAEITVNVSGGSADNMLNVKYLKGSLGNEALKGAVLSEKMNFEQVTGLGRNVFSQCTGMKILVCPAVTSEDRYPYADNTVLETLDRGSSAPNFNYGYTFSNDSHFTTLILRNTSVVALPNINCFSGTPFANGGAGGEIYVPSALLSTYPTSTNWSTINGYGTVTWKAIEGSYYETHYADGTVIA